MAKRETEGRGVRKRIREGRGQGRGPDYQPWLRVHDVASSGAATRVKGWKTRREHHFLSDLEKNYFFILEWSSIVSDIREQYPLKPIDETLAIAERCGVPHPVSPKTKEPVVMTTDFVVSASLCNQSADLARTVKYAKDLQSDRTIEKLEIERRYWQARNVDWGIVTEREIPKVLAKNVEWLHSYRHMTDLPFSARDIHRIALVLGNEILKDGALTKVTDGCDDRLGLEPGSSLTVVRFLLANGHWQVDMHQQICPGKPLLLVSPPTMPKTLLRGVGSVR